MTGESRFAAAALSCALLTVAGCGGGEEREADAPPKLDELVTVWDDRLRHAVEQRRLPPVALEMVDDVGLPQADFVPGPAGDEDVVRVAGGGQRGSKLRWDLDGDGRIGGGERTIIERELYDTVLAVQDGRATDGGSAR